MALGKKRVEDGSMYRVEREVEYQENCKPNKKVVVLAIIGIVFALLLFLLAVFLIYVDPTKTTETEVIVTVTNTPATAAPTTRFATTRLATTVIVTVPVDCVDFSEVELCTITKEEGNCDSEFGQAQCCMTCAVNESCRDLYDGCHKVRQYGLCGEPEYQTDCCASCVYKQP